MGDPLFQRFAYVYAAFAPRCLGRNVTARDRGFSLTEIERATKTVIERND